MHSFADNLAFLKISTVELMIYDLQVHIYVETFFIIPAVTDTGAEHLYNYR